ncbi:TetR/AcrR family transcriptional regulator [Mycobacterium crocinum]|uniref:TetR/AcrR family transcriptional regulator n=3 Tax=Mycolicibacterium TaxID=1866885 RepID=A0ABX8VI60_9MYCO|nr:MULTISPECIES: TetR/AcrR family transcriptional regulator [Mycolicibacterium]APE17017.1 TetR family transcriptional regulator [Mycobacterium sp. WY10]MCV7217273.1 TetR/AcrR family transcriptional regulator [Mycolicibacterium crocinum]QYL17499.1 TetR/AcrR family transcriptional regulator [Mycolicibacterium pallens]ULN42172.1 TetR/AcrR family transcriptional regulator [Mycolicibacterium crocinum]
MVVVSVGERRTQAERTAAMRTRLLDATIECLVTYGYAGTTTPRIAEIAGVTRGAQVHHFRSKEDLVVAAVEYLAQQRIQKAMRQDAGIWKGPDPVLGVLEFLWNSHQGDMFVATIELWVAARTDDVLAKEVARVEPMVNSTLITAIAQLLPDHAARKHVRNVLYTAMDALRGILVVGFVDRDQTQARRRWDRACVYLAAMLSEALAAKDSD